MNSITYIEYDICKKIESNRQAVEEFIGHVPVCPLCGGREEYEDKDGILRSCQPCNSRCIPFIDAKGDWQYLDWGETIERRADGLHVVVKNKG